MLPGGSGGLHRLRPVNSEQQPYIYAFEDAVLSERLEWLNLQMPSFICGDEDVEAETMFDLWAIDNYFS
jgi:hypothetical protein